MDHANDTLYLQIAERIAHPIRSGTLARGERIPSVRELARQQGVSLSTVVQAYRTLEDARLIEARPRSGYFVAARAPKLPEPEPSRPPADSQPVDVSSLGAQVMQLATDPRSATAPRCASTRSAPAMSSCAVPSPATRWAWAASSTPASCSSPTAAWRRSACACAP
jgi:DNA-binding transcriptional regulator YhcF (GntR family)